MERHPRPWWHRPGTRAAVLGGGNARANLNRILKYELGAVANYRADLGVTGALSASALANQIGLAGPLLQATGANQPIVLGYSGEKYGYFPTVAANYFETPATAPNTLVGDMSHVSLIAPDTFTTLYGIAGQHQGAGQGNWYIRIDTSGRPLFLYSTDGTNFVTLTSSATLASVGLSAAQQFYLGVFHDVDNGAAGNDVKFYWWLPGGTPAQLGTTQTTAGAVTRATSTGGISAFRNGAGSGANFGGKGYRSTLYSGNYFAGSGTPVSDWMASDWPETTTNGATKASSTTGEVWTLNNTGAKLAQIVASPQLLFDGAAHWMQAVFALNLPAVLIVVFKPIRWTLADYFFSGAAANSLAITERVASPQFQQFGGTTLANANSFTALNAYNILSSAYTNSIADFTQVNAGAPVTGANSGASNPGGLTGGARNDGTTFGNMQLKEAIVLNAVPSAAKLAQIISLLNSIHTVF